MSIPKEPRQIMINLMYLVLTAMLALNVSSEILHAFKIINASLTKSNSSIKSKNDETLMAFDANEQMNGQRERIKPYNDKAKAISAQADQMVVYLEEWKEKLIKESDGYLIKDGEKEIKREENIDASTHLLVEKNGGNEIKGKLTDFRNFLLAQIKPEEKDAIDKSLPVQVVNPKKSDNNPTGDWSRGTFHNVPTLGAVTLFSKLQNDVRNSEAVILDELFKESSAKQIKFDAITAIAVPKTSYALVGQKVEAQIMLAAYNKSVQPQVHPNSGSIVKTEAGQAYWESTASGVGTQTVNGSLSFDFGNERKTLPWSFQYTVGNAGGAMQLDKMNVFYIGVPNPITISAAGYSLQDCSPSIPGAQVTSKGLGKYDVMVSQVGDINASVVVRTPQGNKIIATMPIRAKIIPDPVAEVAQKSGGGIPLAVFKAQLGVVANLKNFEFDARFVVTSFTIAAQHKRSSDYLGPYQCSSAYFASSKEAEQLMGTLKFGDRVYIETIKARGPDGKIRTIPDLSFVLY